MAPNDSGPRADAVRNREAVLSAAMRVLAARPDATMQRIASDSGVGRTTVYRHFASREQLVRAAVERAVAAERALVVDAIAAGGTAGDVLRRFAHGVVEHGERYRFLEHQRALADRSLLRPEDDAPLLAWLEKAHAGGALRAELPPTWSYALIVGLATAANADVADGRQAPRAAGALLGETLVRALEAA